MIDVLFFGSTLLLLILLGGLYITKGKPNTSVWRKMSNRRATPISMTLGILIAISWYGLDHVRQHRELRKFSHFSDSLQNLSEQLRTRDLEYNLQTNQIEDMKLVGPEFEIRAYPKFDTTRPGHHNFAVMIINKSNLYMFNRSVYFKPLRILPDSVQVFAMDNSITTSNVVPGDTSYGGIHFPVSGVINAYYIFAMGYDNSGSRSIESRSIFRLIDTSVASPKVSDILSVGDYQRIKAALITKNEW